MLWAEVRGYLCLIPHLGGPEASLSFLSSKGMHENYRQTFAWPNTKGGAGTPFNYAQLRSFCISPAEAAPCEPAAESNAELSAPGPAAHGFSPTPKSGAAEPCPAALPAAVVLQHAAPARKKHIPWNSVLNTQASLRKPRAAKNALQGYNFHISKHTFMMVKFEFTSFPRVSIHLNPLLWPRAEL